MKMSGNCKEYAVQWHFTSLSSYLLAPLVLYKTDFQKRSSHLFFSLSIFSLAGLYRLLIKQVFIEPYFIPGIILADAGHSPPPPPKKMDTLLLRSLYSHERR